MIALDATRIDYASTVAGGTDLRFTLDDGTALSYEIENWNSAGTSHVWVNIPSYAAYPTRTRIWMYHGNPAAANAQNSGATWGANVTGDIALSNYGKGGTGTVRLVHTGDQTVSSSSVNSGLPNLEIASTGGTVFFSGDIVVMGNFLYLSGNVDASASTFAFPATQTITPGPIAFNNVIFRGYGTTATLTGTMEVYGALEFGDTNSNSGTINGETINARGSVTTRNNGKLGTTLLRIVGSGDQVITGLDTNPRLPPMEVASTGGTVTFSGIIGPRGTYTYTSGVVDASASLFQFVSEQTITPGSVAYADVTFGGYGVNQTLLSDMTVLGTLSLADTSSAQGSVNGFQILSYGNIAVTSRGKRGSTVIRILGTADRSFSGISGAAIPSVEIDTSGGLTSLSGELAFVASLTHLNGNVDAGTSIARFSSGNATFRPGTVEWANVMFTGSQSVINLNGETVKINSTLTLADTSSSPGSINNGVLEAKGDLAFTNYGKRGSAVLQMSGATLTRISTADNPRLLDTVNVVAKTGGAEARLSNNITYATATWGLNVTSGLMNLNSYDLTLGGSLAVGAGATLRCNGGEFTAGSTSLLGTVECPGYPTYPFNWTGNAGDGNVFTAGNWQGLQSPPADALVVFNSAYCGANCDAFVPSVATLRGIIMEAGYSGTITQGAGAPISVGNKGIRQYGGTFLGSEAAIDLAGPAVLQGGTFRSTSGTLASRTNVTIANTFQHNNGTWQFTTAYQTTRALALGTTTFRNLTFYSNTGFDAHTFNVTGTPTVLGNLSFQRVNATASGTINGGTFSVHGDVNVQASNYIGTMAVRLVGSGNQTVNATTATSHVPNLDIASTGGTVSITGTPVLFHGFTHTSGSVSVAAPSVTLLGTYNSAYTFNAPGVTLNNVTISSMNNHDLVSFNINGNLNVNGNLDLSSTSPSSSLNNGTIRVRGNFAATGGTAWNGNATISLEGPTNSTITQAATTTFGNGTLAVSKTSATVTQLSAISPRQNMNISATSTYNMNGFNLAVTGTLTNNGVLSRGTSPACGTLTTGFLTGNPAVCPPP